MLTPAEQRYLEDIKRSPAMWGEAMLYDRDGSPRRYRDYQREDLDCDHPQIVHLDGRDVGKTIDLSTLALWYPFTHPGKSVLVAAPFQGHLDTIIEEIENQLASSTTLADAIAKGAHGGLTTHKGGYYQINFKHGAKVYFRPAGSAGNSFRSLHVDFLLVDEAAWLPELAWRALRRCLNAGGKFRVYSTPNGKRDTQYYQITEDETWHVVRWPSWISPDWNEAQEADLEKFYGGKDSPGWQREVAGEHGAPAYGAFNPDMVARALAALPDYRKINIFGESFAQCDSEEETRYKLSTMLGLEPTQGSFWLGGDLGYTSDPSELLLFEEQEESLVLVLRIHAERLPYPTLAEAVALIDRAYHPVGLGIDRGGNGISVFQDLTMLDKFRDLALVNRLVAYDFGGSLVFGEDVNGQEVKRRTKEAMTMAINEALNVRRLVLPKSDNQIEDQLCSQTYVLTDRGVIYSKGNDHIVDAMRCALLRWSMVRQGVYEPKKRETKIPLAKLTRHL